MDALKPKEENNDPKTTFETFPDDFDSDDVIENQEIICPQKNIICCCRKNLIHDESMKFKIKEFEKGAKNRVIFRDRE